MNDLDLHTWTVSTSVGTVFSGPVLVESQTLGVHVPPTVQSVLVAAPVYNCNINIVVTCSATLGILRGATENSNIIVCPKISMQHIFLDYLLFIVSSGFKQCSLNNMRKS